MKATTGFQDYIRRNGAPATYLIILISLAVFVVSWLTQGKFVVPLTFPTNWSQPWGILTYPFANLVGGNNLFFFLLELYWLFWVGTSTEGDLGTPRFVAYFALMSVIAALFVSLGVVLIQLHDSGLMVAGLSLPIAALTVTWGVRNKNQQIFLMMVIPMPGWVLAWLTVALTLFGYGAIFHAPLIGLFACLHLGLAYLYATNRLPIPYGRTGRVGGFDFGSRSSAKGGGTRPENLKRHERMGDQYFEDVRKRDQERAERERLRKLFEDSMGDDKDK